MLDVSEPRGNPVGGGEGWGEEEEGGGEEEEDERVSIPDNPYPVHSSSNQFIPSYPRDWQRPVWWVGGWVGGLLLPTNNSADKHAGGSWAVWCIVFD